MIISKKKNRKKSIQQNSTPIHDTNSQQSEYREKVLLKQWPHITILQLKSDSKEKAKLVFLHDQHFNLGIPTLTRLFNTALEFCRAIM